MSDKQYKLIDEFSCTWEVDQDQSSKPSCKRQVIPELRSLMQKLFTPPLTSQQFSHHDSWARCFLLRIGCGQTNLDALGEHPHNQAALQINTHINGHQSQAYPRMKSEKTSQALLVAYLQSSAWYAASKCCAKLGLGNYQESLNKAFAETQQSVNAPQILLAKYDFTYQVRTYAGARLQGKAKGGLLKGDVEAQIRKRSPQGRLKAITTKHLREVLQIAQVTEEQIANCCTLHKLYGEVYHPPKQEKFGVRSAEPTDADWQAIAHLFNQSLQSQPNKSALQKQQQQPIDAQQAKLMLMETCLKAINDYLAVIPSSPQVLSLDESLGTSDDDDRSLLSKQVSDVPTPDEILECAEVQNLIRQAFQQLEAKKQTALILTNLDFNTTEVAKQCEISQSTVSRIVSQPFTNALVKILYQTYHLDRTQLSQRLKEIDLSENVSLYCQSVIDEVLEHHWQQHNLVHLPLSEQVASLSVALKQWFIDDLHVTKLDAVPDTDQRITAFIDSWLQAH